MEKDVGTSYVLRSIVLNVTRTIALDMLSGEKFDVIGGRRCAMTIGWLGIGKAVA